MRTASSGFLRSMRARSCVSIRRAASSRPTSSRPSRPTSTKPPTHSTCIGRRAMSGSPPTCPTVSSASSQAKSASSATRGPTRVTWLRDLVFTKDGKVCSSSSNLPRLRHRRRRPLLPLPKPRGHAAPLKPPSFSTTYNPHRENPAQASFRGAGCKPWECLGFYGGCVSPGANVSLSGGCEGGVDSAFGVLAAAWASRGRRKGTPCRRWLEVRR